MNKKEKTYHYPMTLSAERPSRRQPRYTSTDDNNIQWTSFCHGHYIDKQSFDTGVCGEILYRCMEGPR